MHQISPQGRVIVIIKLATLVYFMICDLVLSYEKICTMMNILLFFFPLSKIFENSDFGRRMATMSAAEHLDLKTVHHEKLPSENSSFPEISFPVLQQQQQHRRFLLFSASVLSSLPQHAACTEDPSPANTKAMQFS